MSICSSRWSGWPARPGTRFRFRQSTARAQVAELPPPAQPAPLESPIAELRGDSHKDLVGELVGLAREIGYTVTFAHTGLADRICNTKDKPIAVAERLEAQRPVGRADP